ncbi:ribosomal subunit interface protein [Longispora fulva]|uniref:Ribosome hibernation promoting factor n=1 Tax=Longispora fulva TaxID=619741 RepID=A0A8J7GVN1_9ACTN|nr:ribosome-associated translation inhibitor RaiA [Longispora fulva]MBG6140405.1 ribosomal subunit interface protein [Longispora fulva]GIG57214.1 ribosomal subunit interface protein [Longispora fulva]
MEIVVKGRNVEVPEHYRVHVADKLAKIEKYDHKLIQATVELLHEPNRRQRESSQRVEITIASRGPVIRSEACGKDFYTALDLAVTKLDARLRRSADRRRVHRGHSTPISVARATAALTAKQIETMFDKPSFAKSQESDGYEHEEHLPGQIVREKTHSAEPVTIDDALSQMELVGHDFYLFTDKETGCPSVVYRRRAYDYGVIRLS